MKVLSEFHDGSVDGVLLDGTNAFLFLSTWNKDRVVMELHDLRSLRMDDFRQGNILFDVRVREGNEITQDDSEHLFGFSDEAKAAKKLAEVHEEKLVVVEMNPSYGASFLAIAKSFKMMSRQTWLNELVTTEKLHGAETK